MAARKPRLAKVGLLGAAAVTLSLGAAVPASASDGPAAAHVPATMLPAESCPIPPHANKKILKRVYVIARNHHASRRVMLSTFETAWVESHVHNLPCGLDDSVGVFQQRPSMGWCTHPKGCRNVTHATRRFLALAIPTARHHPHWTTGQVAQAVQRSKYGSLYDRARPKAKHLIKRARRLTLIHKQHS